MVVAKQPVGEVGDHLEREFGRFAERGVAHVRQHCGFNRTEAFPFRRLDLLERAVLIVGALHEEDRHADVTERFGDVPLAEIRMQPRIAPGAERAIDVGMPALEFLTQNAGIVGFARAADRAKTVACG